MEIGRICLKIAGRDSNKKCVVVDILDKNSVLIDGETRRKRCNILHIEPLNQVLDIKKGASHDEVINAFKKIGLKARITRPKEKKEKPAKPRAKDRLAMQETKSAKKIKKNDERQKVKKEKKKLKEEKKAGKLNNDSESKSVESILE